LTLCLISLGNACFVTALTNDHQGRRVMISFVAVRVLNTGERGLALR